VTIVLLLTGIAANGCISVYLPEPAHGGERVITEETVEPLKPGQSTRADVLHLLGDPTGERREEDRFFVYYWRVTVGQWEYLPVTPLSFPIWEPYRPEFERRGLIIEFTPDNRVRRLKFIKYDEWFDTIERWKKDEE